MLELINPMITKQNKLDKRTKLSRYLRQNKQLLQIAITLAILFGFTVTPTIYKWLNPPMLDPRGSGFEVQAVESIPTIKITPTSTPNRRYLKYKRMPDYEYIISELQMLYVNWEDAADLNSYENGFNPMAINPTSGACGLSQSLPCYKLSSKCELGDIKCDLKWQKDYISGRYGTVTKALEFWYVNNWY